MGTGQGAELFSWEDDCRSGVALAMRHVQCLGKGGEHRAVGV